MKRLLIFIFLLLGSGSAFVAVRAQDGFISITGVVLDSLTVKKKVFSRYCF